MKQIAPAVICLFIAACGAAHSTAAIPTSHSAASGVEPRTTLRHIVIITMENRSFDEMFGTYPGVHGLPSPLPCLPDPAQGGKLVCSYHDTSLVNYGGPHGDTAERADLDNGKMDGFIKEAETQSHDKNPDAVMGYHNCTDLPTYCGFAASGVLLDNFFAATTSFSTPSHQYMVANWAALCTVKNKPSSCVSDNDVNVNSTTDYAYTDITWLLHAAGVTWGYYVNLSGQAQVQGDGDDESGPPPQTYNSVSTWSPLPAFDDVTDDGQFGNIQPGTSFDAQAKAGTLPQVSWVVPDFNHSDHPQADLALGQQWTQKEVSEIENGPDGPSTLIILWWDDWGGFYESVIPQTVDSLGYGFRTPCILLGPLVKKGTIDHQLVTSDAFNKLIEDEFLAGKRLNPKTDGRPDPRPDVRESNPLLGDLRTDLL